MRALSGPERRFADLQSRLGLTELLANDGAPAAKTAALNKDGRGTSLIKDGLLFSDYPAESGRAPKNYKQIRPDFRFGGDFLEVKGDIGSRTWEKLSRDALNDNLRLALLRMTAGCVDDVRLEHHQLLSDDQRLVEAALSRRRGTPDGRRYLVWSHLCEAIASPDSNLAPIEMMLAGRRLPAKIVSGMEQLAAGKMYIVDHQVMGRWERLHPPREVAWP